MNEAIKPCPFCGAGAKWATGRVGCKSCDIYARDERAWNRRAEPQWISVDERLPDDETPVLIMLRGEIAIGELRWEHPSHEETYQACRYWDNPHDDGQDWQWPDVTHWMPLPVAPTEPS